MKAINSFSQLITMTSSNHVVIEVLAMPPRELGCFHGRSRGFSGHILLALYSYREPSDRRLVPQTQGETDMNVQLRMRLDLLRPLKQ